MYLMGISPTAVLTSTDVPAFDVGQIGFVIDTTGTKGYVYVQDSGAGITGDGYVCLISSAGVAIMASTTTSAPGTGAGKQAGVARAAIAASGFGWIQIYGPGTVRTLTLAAAYTLLNTTGTAGCLDDDATASSEVIEGMIIDTATGGATANTSGFLNWPKVSRTL